MKIATHQTEISSLVLIRNNAEHTRSDVRANRGGVGRKELDMDLGLKAENNAQKIVLDYLEANVSEVLAEKIRTGDKTLGQCWTYIVKQAQKQKQGSSQNSC